jgi:hypothetical protein
MEVREEKVREFCCGDFGGNICSFRISNKVTPAAYANWAYFVNPYPGDSNL